MPDPIYVPVLKARQAELAALSEIQPATRKAILPVLEIAPSEVDDPQVVSDAVDRISKKLEVWGGNELIVDAGFLSAGIRLPSGQGATMYATAKARSLGIGAIPVARLSDGDSARADVRNLQVEYDCGVAVRLSMEDMDEDPEELDSSITALLGDVSVRRDQADLILDLASVQGDIAVRGGSRIVLDVLRELEKVEQWRRVIVTSGAFPVDLSSVVPWVQSEFQRYDAALWDAIRGRRRLPRIPIYGDYSVAFPLLVSGPPFAPAPQLRYTLGDRWLFLKGRKNDPRGSEQFYEVCEQVAMHSEFAGAALGTADARIASPREHGPGNGSTWRKIGTVHHLDFVVGRITTLGEP
ncbi:beta family protein [Umezawaea endophytica]|uniref:Beta family protein n=1 Tax=Umezawaea endophytica TaxID=1654476 RepID=A0A9X2VLY2_9PSEU|nr:beta family protein [Umezawaea endophytica]MCS7479061.1 beta family protein [Umezawaea endophytica]